jgi:hypothetical protein
VHIRTPDFPSRFISASTAMSKADLREQVISDCMRQIAGLRHRLTTLEGIPANIPELLEQVRVLLEQEQAKAKAKKKPRKRELVAETL